MWELTMAEHLDRYELRILALLQEDASRPTTEIAEIVGLSQAPCWRRIQRLKEAGYSKKTVCLLDRRKLGLNAEIFAKVKLSANGRAEVSRSEERRVGKESVITFRYGGWRLH